VPAALTTPISKPIRRRLRCRFAAGLGGGPGIRNHSNYDGGPQKKDGQKPAETKTERSETKPERVVLRRASVRYAEERLALGAAHADSGYVAVNEAGEPYAPDTLTRMWHKLAKAAGVREIRLHDARQSCGTALHLRGVPLAVIAKWLGRADASITARLYTHSQDEALRAAGQSLGAVVTSS
jgi:integrase